MSRECGERREREMIEFKTIFPSLGHFEECLGLLTCDKHAWLHEQGCNFSVAKTAV